MICAVVTHAATTVRGTDHMIISTPRIRTVVLDPADHRLFYTTVPREKHPTYKSSNPTAWYCSHGWYIILGI